MSLAHPDNCKLENALQYPFTCFLALDNFNGASLNFVLQLCLMAYYIIVTYCD